MELLTRDNLPLQIPLDGIYPSVSVMEELHVPLNSFIGLPVRVFSSTLIKELIFKLHLTITFFVMSCF